MIPKEPEAAQNDFVIACAPSSLPTIPFITDVRKVFMKSNATFDFTFL